MDYNFIELTISDLINLINKGLVDLNPSYQRNYIWSPNDQKQLIDTILKGYPLPNFFIYERPDGKFEMVDGQQRSKTIYRFVDRQITSSKDTGSQVYNEKNKEFIDNYRLPFIKISNLKQGETLNDYYVLINKKGVRLNSPEVNKSEFHDSVFMKLANEVLSYQGLIDLDLFTEVASKRMNDRAFIEELLVYLKFGIGEKKDDVGQVYKKHDFDEIEYDFYKQRFFDIIDLCSKFNLIFKISNTRYKQKNDFYTLFCFLNDSLDVDLDVLIYQYKILLVLDRRDSIGRQFIRPSNDQCEPLKNYAIHCVSQSNSAKARKARLGFFNSVLKNELEENNEELEKVVEYLEEQYDTDISLINVGRYLLIDLTQIY